jgi:hypothetical protein
LPAVFDGPIDNPSFLAYVEQILVPSLQPGDVVVLDNLVLHKQAAVCAAIEQVGALIRFLPLYRPDFNAIDLVRQIESVPAGGAAAQLRSRQHAGCHARPLRRPNVATNIRHGGYHVATTL